MLHAVCPTVTEVLHKFTIQPFVFTPFDLHCFPPHGLALFKGCLSPLYYSWWCLCSFRNRVLSSLRQHWFTFMFFILLLYYYTFWVRIAPKYFSGFGVFAVCQKSLQWLQLLVETCYSHMFGHTHTYICTYMNAFSQRMPMINVRMYLMVYLSCSVTPRILTQERLVVWWRWRFSDLESSQFIKSLQY